MIILRNSSLWVCPGRIWSRFADLQTLRPIFSGRSAALLDGRHWHRRSHLPEGDHQNTNPPYLQEHLYKSVCQSGFEALPGLLITEI